MERVWLSPQEAADYLGVSRATIYRWINDSKLTVYKVERISRLKKDDLDRLMEEGKKE